MSNFKVEILSIIKCISLTKEKTFYKIKIFNETTNEIIDIEQKKYFNLYAELAKAHAEFRLYADSNKSTGLFREYLSIIYQRKKKLP